jgi:hypothetical protein
MSASAKAIGDVHKGHATALLALENKIEDSKKEVNQYKVISNRSFLRKTTKSRNYRKHIKLNWKNWLENTLQKSKTSTNPSMN